MRELVGVVLGSSVAAAEGGWTFMLADSLKLRGWQIINVATPGYNTTRCLRTLEKDIKNGLKGINPDIVIGMKAIIHTIVQQYKTKVVLGGVYPCNHYDNEHYAYLKAMKKEMEAWQVPLLDFLSVTDDGQGHWKEEIYEDALHPNKEGHKAMFEAIDLKLFDSLKEDILTQAGQQKVAKF